MARFRARADKIRSALLWLKLHNKYYQHITIDDNALDQYPIDGDVSSFLTSHQYSSDDSVSSPSSDDEDYDEEFGRRR